MGKAAKTLLVLTFAISSMFVADACMCDRQPISIKYCRADYGKQRYVPKQNFCGEKDTLTPTILMTPMMYEKMLVVK